MKVIIEDSTEGENKRKTTVECEGDEVSVYQAMDMAIRALMAYGYPPEAFMEYFDSIAKGDNEEVEQADTEAASSADEG